MLNIFVPRSQGMVCAEREPGAPFPADAVWIDLREPTPEEISDYDNVELCRIGFGFTRRDYGRLRQLIVVLHSW